MREVTQSQKTLVTLIVIAIPWAIICAFWVFWGWRFSRQGEL